MPDTRPILPKGLPPLATASSAAPDDLTQEVIKLISTQRISNSQIQQIIEAIPTETLRELVRKVAGTDESFLMTFKKQVALVDAVINQLVDKQGNLKPRAEEVEITLKDALTLSTKVSEMMVRHLPKLYTVDRIQRLERAIGDVMEEFMTAEQQQAVLLRLHELTAK